jgi:hypothetical protein
VFGGHVSMVGIDPWWNEASLNWCFSSGIVVVSIHGMGVSMVLLCVCGSCINDRY